MGESRLGRLGRFIVIAAAEAIIGVLAVGTLVLLAAPSPFRDAVVLAIWPMVIVGGTVVAWRWLGQSDAPKPTASQSELTEVIVRGRALRERLYGVAHLEVSDDERAAWKVRVNDWYDDASAVVDRVAHDRLPTFRHDALYTDYPERDLPDWVKGLLLDLDVRIEQLVVIRASL